MLSKAQIKHIQALRKKKDRKEHQQFVIEGRKIIDELIDSDWETEVIYCSTSFSNKHKIPTNAIIVEDHLFLKISGQSTPEGILALVKNKKHAEITADNIKGIALDRIQDPGNLGSIIRIADWYGIEHIICSSDSVDCYNAKSLQASMGSIFRVKIHYINLKELPKNTELFVAEMKGEDYREVKPLEKGLLLIGNEAHGVGNWINDFDANKITIPRHGNAESLNAAIACGILSAHLFG